MGSHHRSTIALFLIVFILLSAAAGRGDGTLTRVPAAPMEPSSPQNTASTTPPTKPVTTEYETEYYTSIGTTIIIEESNKDLSQLTPTQQSLTVLTSAPGSTNGTVATAQNVTPTVGSSKAKLLSHSVTTVLTYITEDSGTGTGFHGTGGEKLITTSLGESTTDRVDLTSDEVDTTRGPGSTDIVAEVTTLVNNVLTSKLAIMPEDIENTITTTDELPTTTQDTDFLPFTTEHTDITTVLIPESTTASEVLTSASATTLGEQSTNQFASTSETLTTSDHITSAPLTTPERATTALLLTSLPPTTPEKATTSMLHTSLPPTTPEKATTLMLHSSLPPTAPERATTVLLHASLQPTTTSRASSGGPSTTHVAQTTVDKSHDFDHYRILASDLSQDEIENIATLHFSGISEDEWVNSYDESFRRFLSTTLTSNTDFNVEPKHIYYIRPTPYEYNNILYVSVLARPSSRKRSLMPFVPLNEILGALSNLTALTSALGIPLSQAPNITTGLPDFILPTSPSISTKEPTTTTRKPPPTIGFLSNPGLFISLVVIATVSIIIIIVGLIYLLCDRRRGRSGEYSTNHTPRNSDLELGFDNPVMAENDKNVLNGNHLSSIKGEMESDMIVPYDNFTQEELMNYEVEDTHL